VRFEAVNVESDPEALQELRRLHVLQMPAVTMGDRVFRGWDPKGLAAFVGVDYTQPARLSFQELHQRFVEILAAAVRGVRQVPEIHLLMPLPGRDRTVRDLGYHIFLLSLAYCDAMEQGCFPEEWILQEVPPEITNVSALADYGEEVRERLHRQQAKPGSESARIETSSGYQTTHELLERTVWHAAQHLRQLYALLGRMGETPVDPLTDEDFRGLPLPKEVW
jgi:hypothetical protein